MSIILLKMLIIKLFNTKMCLLKKMAVKVDRCCTVFVQPHVVYCSVCKALDWTHFVRNLKSGLAYWD